MLEASHAVSRITALIAFSALFAGAWSLDRSPETLALRERPRTTPLVRTKPVPRPLVATPTSTTFAGRVEVTERRLTVSIEDESLQISPDVIERHLSQLPLGIAAGDYRIVDAQGGVGWLRVRGGMATTGVPQLTTTVDEQPMRFIRIATPQVSDAQRRQPAPR